MKKCVGFLIVGLLTMFSLFSNTQAVVFDYGGVMTKEFNRPTVVRFLCDTFSFTEEEFEKINLEKKEAIKSGKSDADFWIAYAQQNEISLPPQWPQELNTAMIEALGVNAEMYVLVAELKSKQIPVALLSNIDDRLAKLLRDQGLYAPFEPCLLSCDLGVAKPDPKIYTLLIEKLRLPPEEILFVDDRQENVEAAKQCGIDAIVFTSVPQLQEELHKRNLFVLTQN